MAGHDQRFFVGQRDRLARAVAASVGRSPIRPEVAATTVVTAGCVAAGQPFDAVERVGEQLGGLRLRRGVIAGIGDDLWRKLARLFGQQGDIAARRQRHHAEAIGKSPHDIQGLPPDGAGAAPSTVIPWRESAFCHSAVRPPSGHRGSAE